MTKEAATLSEGIDVTPHLRLPAVGRDIEFMPRQCLAELIDNASDDFLTAPPPDEKPTVAITLPGRCGVSGQR